MEADVAVVAAPVSAGPLQTVRAGVLAMSRATQVVYGLTFLWGAGFAAVAAVRESLFLDRRYDLGNFTQAVWTTAHGHFLEVTEVGGAQVSRLGIHVDPILVLFVPFWWAWPSPALLLVVQALAFAAGELPLFWLARKHLAREKDAALVAAAYLLCPSVGWNAIVEFHTVALAVPLLLFAIWFLDEARWTPFAVAAGLAMLCQEQIGLIVGCLGLWYAWRARRLVPGLAIASAGFLVSAVDFGLVIRHFSGGSPYSGRFEGAGGSLTDILRNVLTDPARVTSAIRLSDLLGLLLVLPVLAFCFGSSLTLVAAPQVALLLLSDRVADWFVAGQNVLPIIPFVYAGTVFALARAQRAAAPRRARIAAGHVLAASIAVALTIGPAAPFDKHLPSSSRVSAEREAVRLVPANARVSVTNHLGSQLAARRYLYVFPVVQDANWVVVDEGDNFLPPRGTSARKRGLVVGVHDLYWQPGLMKSSIRRLQRSPDWHQVYDQHGVYVFARRSAAAA
jgi:uncharacterized membrane protein